MFALFLFAIFPLILVHAALSDMLSFTISNKVSLLLVAAFAMAAPSLALDWTLIGLHVAVAMAALVVGIGLFSMGWIGGGDAKLAAAICLWMGPDHVLPFLFYTGVFGFLLSLMIVVTRWQPLPASLLRVTWIERLASGQSGVPYGIALSSAGIIVYFQSSWTALIG